mgnify:CR=1 FL=1
MREITFKGKRVDNEEWVYGFLTKMWGKYHIIDENNENVAYEIIPGTVGQYTGLTDKNGKKIFEGDIVKTTSVIGKNIYEVCFSEARRGWFPFACGDGCGCCEDEVECPEYVEIIGNIYDNKEILEDKE